MSVPLARVTSLPDASAAEQALLDRIRRDDDDAFAELFATYYQPLCGFTNNYVRSPEIAKELVQDVFSRIWEQRDVLGVMVSVRAYLYGAARNHAFNFLKRERRWHKVLETASVEHQSPGLGHESSGPDDALHHRELAAAFDSVVEELSEGQRTVLLLRWQHQLSYYEIADVLGISRKGVDQQLGRALKIIRRRLAAFR